MEWGTWNKILSLGWFWLYISQNPKINVEIGQKLHILILIDQFLIIHSKIVLIINWIQCIIFENRLILIKNWPISLKSRFQIVFNINFLIWIQIGHWSDNNDKMGFWIGRPNLISNPQLPKLRKNDGTINRGKVVAQL